MKRSVFLGLLIIFLITNSWSQERPKIALVLSGGGAKGMAHIPLLQKLDSLGIVPDLVVGTSMGAVLGGLYASGYSGDTLAYLSENMDWNALLSNKIPLSSIGTSEKDEFDRYAIVLELYKGGVEIPLGVIEGQELGLMLSKLFFPVRNVRDFDNLKIPFRCVTTDIVNGQRKVFKSGDIVQAIRASMAIPTIFTPVDHDGTLLVDGGVVDNFPVDVALEEGAHIVIGSDVSGGLASKDEISSSLMSLVFQTGMILSARRNSENQDNTTILIDHAKYLTYETADFSNATEIIEQGNQALTNALPKLISLSRQRPKENYTENDIAFGSTDIVLSHVQVRGVDNGMQSFVRRRLDFEMGGRYSLTEIERSVRNLYGLQMFKKVDFRVWGNGNGDTLVLNIKERRLHSLKTGIHFDSDRGVGVLVNLTSRNLLGSGSRLLTTIDVAENPGARFQVQKTIGERGKWWARAELKSETSVQQYLLNNQLSSDYNFNYRSGILQLNKELSINDYIGAGLKMEFNRLRPKLSADDRGIPKDSLTLEFDKLSNENYGVFLRLEHNSLNKRFFPTRGSFLFADAQYNIRNQITVDYHSDLLSEISGQLQQNIKMEFDYEQVIPVSKQLQFRSRLYLGQNFENTNTEKDFGFYEFGVLQYFFLGGLEQRRENYFIPFPGLRAGAIPASQIITFNLAAQWSFLPNLYLTPSVNIAAFGQSSVSDFWNDLGRFQTSTGTEGLETAKWLQALSADLAYMSLLGPIHLEASFMNFKDYRVYFSLGFFL